MKKKEFCNELVNQINYYLRKENISFKEMIRIQFLDNTLMNYCYDAFEYVDYCKNIINSDLFLELTYNCSED